MCTLIKELDFYFILSLFHKFVPLLSKYFLFKNCNTYQIKQTYDSLFRCGCGKKKLRTRIEQSKWLFCINMKTQFSVEYVTFICMHQFSFPNTTIWNNIFLYTVKQILLVCWNFKEVRVSIVCPEGGGYKLTIKISKSNFNWFSCRLLKYFG